MPNDHGPRALPEIKLIRKALSALSWQVGQGWCFVPPHDDPDEMYRDYMDAAGELDCDTDEKFADGVIDRLLAALTAAPSPWRPISELPNKPALGMHIDVREIETYRWAPYKPTSQERRRGKLGRWQKFNGYGFDGSYSEPDGYEWCEL